MRRIIPQFILLVVAIILWVCLAPSAIADSQTGGSISGKVYFNTGNQNIPNGTVVSLVNASNVSEYIPGFNMTPDQNGFFQFTNVSHGSYMVYGWSPYYTEGYSAGIDVTTNTTYTASVVLMAMPYYANITSSTQHVVYGSSADITVQVADYWGRPVGSGWQILLRTTVGIMNPDSAFTNSEGKVYSNLPWVDNMTPAEITTFAIATNGTSYGLLENIDLTPASPTPEVTVSATPTASPTAEPNATAVPSVTTTPIPSATATPQPTPGFVLMAGLAAMGIALAIRKYK
jgi:hypothetical protein